MDSEVKKHRRRSVRNLRRSACFVPPSVDYGSAWIGENQETNICNLVRSLEDLNCQDEIEDNAYKSNGRFVDDVDNACDGFKSSSSSSQQWNGNCFPRADDKDAHSTGQCDVSYSLVDSLPKTVKSPVNGSSISLTKVADVKMYPTEHRDTHRLEHFYNNPLANTQNLLTSNDISKALTSESHTSSCQRIDLLSGLDEAGKSNVQLGNEDVHDVCDNDHSKKLRLRDNQMPDINDKSCKILSHKSVFLLTEDNSTIEDCEVENDKQIVPLKTPLCTVSCQGNNIRTLPKCAIDNENHKTKSGLNQESLVEDFDQVDSNTDCVNLGNFHNNSMSPEYIEDYCVNSTASTPSNDNLNRALTSFLDTSSTSAFNISFSPMDIRPGTPTSSSVPQNAIDQFRSSGQLQESITQIICSLEDSLVASDPVTHQLFCESGVSFNSDDSLQTCELSYTNKTNGLNQTYTLGSLNSHNDQPVEEILSNSVTESSSNSSKHYNVVPSSIEGYDVENVIGHFDFKKPKHSGRRSSKAFTVPCFSVTDDQISPVSQYHTSDHDKEYSEGTLTPVIESPLAVIATSSAEHLSANTNLDEIDKDVLKTVCNINSNDVVGEKLLELIPVSNFSDCDNVLILNEQKKLKKQRRKSNQLSRLLEESKRFLPESTDHSHMNNKENEDLEENVDAQQCSKNNQSKSLRNRRGRKSWDFRKEAQIPINLESNLTQRDSQEEKQSDGTYLSKELEDLHTLYQKQNYVSKSPKPLETLKENSNEKNAFSKRSLKRYLTFERVTSTKEKKRMKKALAVYKNRQYFFPITDQEFERKMLDVQLFLET